MAQVVALKEYLLLLVLEELVVELDK